MDYSIIRRRHDWIGPENRVLGGFLLSLLLSPLIGIIVALASKSVSTDKAEKELVKLSQEQTKALGTMQRSTYVTELHKLKELYDSGLISMEEFKKEKEILDRDREP